METKVCAKCGQELPTSEFNRCNGNKDGLQAYCKQCHRMSVKLSAKRREEKKAEQERAEFEKKYKIYTNRDLAKFTPRDLMLELKARGYEGELLYVEHIVKKHFIDLSKLD